MRVRVAFQTISWGIRFRNVGELDTALSSMSELGYEGVEFSQRPDALGVKDFRHLQQILDRHNLHLLGFTGGTLAERTKFCEGRSATSGPDYLYVEDWDRDFASSAIRQGFTLALHPRTFSTVRRVHDAQPLLQRYRSLKLLPDTAHLTIVGEDPATVIRIFRDRLAAIHFKDWIPDFGRSCHRFARGFTELGQGIVDWTSVLAAMREIDYDGWIVAELDSAYKDPYDGLTKCAAWLTERGLLISKSSVTARNPIPIQKQTAPSGRFSAADARFMARILEACTRGRDFYQSVAEAFYGLAPSTAIKIWACSPAQDRMGLIAMHPPGLPSDWLEPSVLNISKSLSGIANDRQAAMTPFNLRVERPGEVYGYPKRRLLHKRMTCNPKIRQMLAIPIFNSGNQNYVRLIVNVFTRGKEWPRDQDWYNRLARIVTRASDSVLDDLCAGAAGSVIWQAQEALNYKDFLSKLIKIIGDALQCEATALFLVNEAGDKLELAASTGTDWEEPHGERFYRAGEGLTGKVWQTNQALLSPNFNNEPGHKGKSSERIPSGATACLWVPFVTSRNKVIGVVRCSNKQSAQHPAAEYVFSDDDVAIIETIGRAAVGHLQMLRDEDRVKALRSLHHEIQVPIGGIRAATERALHTQGRLQGYFKEVWEWTKSAVQILNDAQVLEYEAVPRGVAVPTPLMEGIIMPLKDSIDNLLETRGLTGRAITYKGLKELPPLRLDRHWFLQAFYHLIRNCIVYAKPDVTTFRVEIEGSRDVGTTRIRVRDWGVGIDGDAEAIFNQGYRSAYAKQHVKGTGIGLWVVRQIVEAHGGRIDLTHHATPTEFTISLPDRPPDSM